MFRDTSGNPKRYKIGTTASIDIGPKRYLLFAFAKTDINTLKAYATVHELWDALAGLWGSVTVRSNGEPVYIPLVGSGLSGVGLPARNILQILMYFIFLLYQEAEDHRPIDNRSHRVSIQRN